MVEVTFLIKYETKHNHMILTLITGAKMGSTSNNNATRQTKWPKAIRITKCFCDKQITLKEQTLD